MCLEADRRVVLDQVLHDQVQAAVTLPGVVEPQALRQGGDGLRVGTAAISGLAAAVVPALPGRASWCRRSGHRGRGGRRCGRRPHRVRPQAAMHARSVAGSAARAAKVGGRCMRGAPFSGLAREPGVSRKSRRIKLHPPGLARDSWLTRKSRRTSHAPTADLRRARSAPRHAGRVHRGLWRTTRCGVAARSVGPLGRGDHCAGTSWPRAWERRKPQRQPILTAAWCPCAGRLRPAGGLEALLHLGV